MILPLLSMGKLKYMNIHLFTHQYTHAYIHSHLCCDFNGSKQLLKNQKNEDNDQINIVLTFVWFQSELRTSIEYDMTFNRPYFLSGSMCMETL